MGGGVVGGTEICLSDLGVYFSSCRRKAVRANLSVLRSSVGGVVQW